MRLVRDTSNNCRAKALPTYTTFRRDVAISDKESNDDIKEASFVFIHIIKENYNKEV